MTQIEQLYDARAGLKGFHLNRENSSGIRRVDALSSANLQDNLSDATVMLAAIKAGDSKSAEQLLVLVYDELRRLAASKLAYEAPGQTLQPTALVHEAWLRLVGDHTPSFKDREVPADATPLDRERIEVTRQLNVDAERYVAALREIGRASCRERV